MLVFQNKPHDPGLEEKRDGANHVLVVGSEQHLHGRGDEREVEENGEHVEILLFVAVFCHSPRKAFS